MTWSDESRFLLHHRNGWVLGTTMHYGNNTSQLTQCEALGSVLLEILGPAIHFDVTLTPTYAILQIMYAPFHRNSIA